jgi:hypothetical protein
MRFILIELLWYYECLNEIASSITISICVPRYKRSYSICLRRLYRLNQFLPITTLVRICLLSPCLSIWNMLNMLNLLALILLMKYYIKK